MSGRRIVYVIERCPAKKPADKRIWSVEGTYGRRCDAKESVRVLEQEQSGYISLPRYLYRIVNYIPARTKP